MSDLIKMSQNCLVDRRRNIYGENFWKIHIDMYKNSGSKGNRMAHLCSNTLLEQVVKYKVHHGKVGFLYWLWRVEKLQVRFFFEGGFQILRLDIFWH